MVVIILARGGSKGLPNKNIKMLGNKCMSHHAIDALMKSSLDCNIIYSSDNKKYLSLAEEFVRTLFADKVTSFISHIRSSQSANDHASSWEAVAEIINELEIQNDIPILLISGVCPAITPNDIDTFIDRVKNARSGLSVRLNDYPVESTFFINKDGYVEPHALTKKISARQHAKIIYRPDGHLYFRIAGDIKNGCTFPDKDTISVDLFKDYYINIDTSADFEYAKYIMEYRND